MKCYEISEVENVILNIKYSKAISEALVGDFKNDISKFSNTFYRISNVTSFNV